MLFISVLFNATAPTRAAATDQQIGDAIERIKKYLYAQQDHFGGWDASLGGHAAQFATGNTALVVMALLYAGESVHHPKLDKALHYLEKNESDGLYSVALRAHVWAALPNSYHKQLTKEAEWLKQAQRQSLFGYTRVYDPNTKVDLSCTQYGVLGLWEYAKRDGKISTAFWNGAIKQMLQLQNADGGWTYGRHGDSMGSMTTAGLTVLYIAQQEAKRKNGQPDPDITHAIEQGLAWLDQRFDGGQVNPIAGGGDRGWPLYYLYGIERIALAGGVKMLNGRDWYQAGAENILTRLGGGGSVGSISDTAFALAFLSRGRVPVWISKLKVEGQAWNNRPNDVYFWNQRLERNTERRLNWQIISADDSLDIWRSAPVAYLSSNQAIKFSDKQKKNLKQYLDSGGVLLAAPEGNSPGFTLAIKKLAKELYPDLSMRPARSTGTDKDLIYQINYKLDPQDLQPINILSNGARDLIYLVKRDWSLTFQIDQRTTPDSTWKLATNFFSLATDRGRLDNRLDAIHANQITRDQIGEFTIARATYDGRWDVEPFAWNIITRAVISRCGLKINTQNTPLADLADCPHRLVHLTGADDATALTQAQLNAIKTYVERGGTILVENVGGKSSFERNVAGQLQRFLNMSPVDQIPFDHPVISGKNLPGGESADRVQFTPSLTTRIRVGDSPRFRAFYINNRPAIILSGEDLTLAAMNVRQWGVIGYHRDSALKLLTNLVLHVRQSEK